MAKFRRGDPVATRAVADKKLRGQLRHSEALAQRAQHAAAKAEQWLLPNEAGGLEAEGLERTWRFSQVAPELMRVGCMPLCALSAACTPKKTMARCGHVNSACLVVQLYIRAHSVKLLFSLALRPQPVAYHNDRHRLATYVG